MYLLFSKIYILKCTFHSSCLILKRYSNLKWGLKLVKFCDVYGWYLICFAIPIFFNFTVHGRYPIYHKCFKVNTMCSYQYYQLFIFHHCTLMSITTGPRIV